jgi:hypothetical protein
MRNMQLTFNTKSKVTSMKIYPHLAKRILIVLAIMSISQFADAASTDHYNSLQTITYSGASESFQQNIRAIVRSTTVEEDGVLVYRMAFEGGITYPSEDNPTIAK